MGRARSRRSEKRHQYLHSSTGSCRAGPDRSIRALRQRILSLAVVLSTLVCVASYPVPPSGTVFCSKETGAVDIFAVTGNKAVLKNADPPTVLFIGLNDKRQLRTFQTFAVQHRPISKAMIVDNSGDGWNITLLGVVIAGHSDQIYTSARPLVKLRFRSFKYAPHKNAAGTIVPNLRCL